MPQFVAILPIAGLTLAWLAPLHLLPWVSWHGEVPVFAAFFLAALWAVAARRATPGSPAVLPLPGIALVLLGIAVLAIAQAATGLIRFWGDAWILVLYLGLGLAAFLLGREAAGSRPGGAIHADALAATLVLAAIGSSIIALVQTLDVWTTVEWIARTPNLRRPGGNLAQANQMGTLVLMGLVGLCYLYERARLSGGVAWLVALLLAIGLATTESRTALLSSAALVLWWALWRAHRPVHGRAVALMVAAVALGYVFWPQGLTAFHGLEGADAPAAMVDTQVGLRAVVWPQLVEAAMQRPLLGWGLRQVPAALTTVLDQQAVSEAYPYAHNIVIDLLLGAGVPVTLLLLSVTALWVWNRRGAGRDTVGWFAMGIAVPFAVHAMFEFPHTYAYLLAPVFFGLGLVDAQVQPRTRVRIPAAAAAALLAGITALGAWSVAEYVAIEEDFRVARFEAGRIGATPAAYQRPKIHLLTQLDILLHAARIVPAPGMRPEDIKLSHDAAYRFPWPALQNRYALALALNGDPAEAGRILRVIRAMHGASAYSAIRANWQALAAEKYPQLLNVPAP